MKWLKSATSKTWTVEGKIIPAVDSGNYLQLDEQTYNSIVKRPVIASLLKAGGILSFDEEPAELKNSIEGLTKSNIDLVQENRKLLKKVQELEQTAKNNAPVDIEAIKAEAQEEIKAEAVKELQVMQDQLDEKDKQIAKLEKKLAKYAKDGE